MKQQKNSKTKKTLLSSIIVLIVCVAMLLGTTFAWFTDSVSNTGNRIQAGKLKIDLLMDKTMTTSEGSHYVSISGADSQGDIFKTAAIATNSNATLWEPGKTQIVFLAVENQGNLALKYQTHIDVTDNGLVGSLEYALFDGAKYTDFVAAEKTNWADLKAIATETGNVEAGRKTLTTGVLDEIAKGTKNERDYVALAVHMKEDAGNEYQGKDIIIDVTLAATQMTAEKDGFGSDQYDKEAVYPEVPVPIHIVASSDNLAMTGSSTEINKIDGKDASSTSTIAIKTEGSEDATATIAKSVAGDKMTELLNGKAKTDQDREMVLKLKVDTVEKSETSITYEITPTANLKYTNLSGTEVTEEDVPINTAFSGLLVGDMFVGKNLKNVVFKHSGVEMEKLATADAIPINKEVGGYFYNPESGESVIKATKFSPFTMTCDKAVAAINGKAYYSLEDAIKAVQIGETIYVQRDVTNAIGITIDKKIKFAIDFGGHTYTVSNPAAGSTGTKNQAFQLKKDQTITFKNGTINLATSNTQISRIIQNYANLTLENMKFDDAHLVKRGEPMSAADSVIESDCGTVVIKGNSSITTTGGRNAIAVDYWENYYPAGTSVTIQDNFNTNGKIRLYSENTTESGTDASSLSISSGTYGGIYEDANTSKVSATLTGGTYSEKPADKYIAEDYKAKDNGNGTWTVILKVAPTPDPQGVFTANSNEDLTAILEELNGSDKYTDKPYTIKLTSGVTGAEWDETRQKYVANVYVIPQYMNWKYNNGTGYQDLIAGKKARVTIVGDNGSEKLLFRGIFLITGHGYSNGAESCYDPNAATTIQNINFDFTDVETANGVTAQKVVGNENGSKLNPILAFGACSNVTIDDCAFKNTERVKISASQQNNPPSEMYLEGKINKIAGYAFCTVISNCKYENVSSVADGYFAGKSTWQNTNGKYGIKITNVIATGMTSGFVNAQTGGNGDICVENCTLSGSGYGVRLQGGNTATVKNSSMMISGGDNNVVAFKGNGNSTVILENVTIPTGGSKNIDSSVTNSKVYCKGTTPSADSFTKSGNNQATVSDDQ